METVAHQEQLHNWQQRVQQELQSRLSAAMQVWCKLQQETLLVLVQHGAAPVDRQQTFHILQQALLAQPLPAVRQVKMFLRVAGEKQPYADLDFTILSLRWCQEKRSRTDRLLFCHVPSQVLPQVSGSSAGVVI
ncbi:MAG: hypothetical protein GDA43_17725 [Hormoscilla sp. SP5CHS1]|nr:hypothetical protein [Hormoscilla sp. SP12CHS1]MBC6454806.1 hypothetical protein [Hormoscilla sp. SP5CHS1]